MGKGTLLFTYTLTGLAEAETAIASVADIKPAVRMSMVDAAGKIYKQAAEYEAAAMLQGPYNESAVARSVSRSKARSTKDGATQKITFKGEQHGNRIAEIAFVNNYGKKSQPARPFIDKAQKESESVCVKEAAKVLDEYLKTHNL